MKPISELANDQVACRLIWETVWHKWQGRPDFEFIGGYCLNILKVITHEGQTRDEISTGVILIGRYEHEQLHINICPDGFLDFSLRGSAIINNINPFRMVKLFAQLGYAPEGLDFEVVLDGKYAWPCECGRGNMYETVAAHCPICKTTINI